MSRSEQQSTKTAPRTRLKNKPPFSIAPYRHLLNGREKVDLESGLMLSCEVGDAEVFG